MVSITTYRLHSTFVLLGGYACDIWLVWDAPCSTSWFLFDFLEWLHLIWAFCSIWKSMFPNSFLYSNAQFITVKSLKYYNFILCFCNFVFISLKIRVHFLYFSWDKNRALLFLQKLFLWRTLESHIFIKPAKWWPSVLRDLNLPNSCCGPLKQI